MSKNEFISIPPIEERLEKNEGYKEIIETESGKYNILYNIHGGLGKSKPIPGKELEGKDGLIMEAAGISESLVNKKQMMSVLKHNYEEKSVHIELIRTAIENCIPIFFLDVSDKFRKEIETGEFKEKLKALAEGLVGGSIVVTVLIKSKDKPLNRREFLKKSTAYLAGAYLSTPLVKEMAAFSMNKSGIIRDAGRINDKIHPEFDSFLVNGRNNLIAQKSESVARMLAEESGRKPDLAISIGAAHYGIEDSFRKSDQERMDIIKSYNEFNLEDEALIIRVDITKTEDNKKTLSVSKQYAPGFNKN